MRNTPCVDGWCGPIEISSNSPMGVPLSSSFGFTSKLFGGMAATVLMLSPPLSVRPDNVFSPPPKLRRAASARLPICRASASPQNFSAAWRQRCSCFHLRFQFDRIMFFRLHQNFVVRRRLVFRSVELRLHLKTFRRHGGNGAHAFTSAFSSTG